MFPDGIQDKLIDIGSMVLKTGTLDNKTKALIALSTAIATYCIHCRDQSKSLARKFGATEVEIEDAENIALRMRQKCQNQSGSFSFNALTETPNCLNLEGGEGYINRDWGMI